MKLNFLTILFAYLLLAACNNKAPADLLVTGANIQTMDSALTNAEAMVIKDGNILAIGSKQDLLARFEPKVTESYNDGYIYPGILDAHCHFYGLGMFMQMVDLTGCKSFEEAVERCKAFHAKKPGLVLLGRGWDQTKWKNKAFPNNQLLNESFPDVPVLLKRVDGHAAIANNVALSLAGIDINSKVAGGELLLFDKKLSGVLIDNAVDLVEQKLPKPARITQINALLDAQKECLKYGITSVTDAGLDYDVVELIDSLHQAGLLKIHMNIMLSLSKANFDWLNQKGGPILKPCLQVLGFKMYADGALGSRGACLVDEYHDRHGHKGLLLTSLAEMESWVKLLAEDKNHYQLNTHAIGDSSNRIILNLYGKYLGENNDRRWRIEHAQVLQPSDFHLFKDFSIIPSVQPTHATSDMYWAEQRLGSNRIKGAYAYKTLLNQLGWMPLGTDFPVEYVSPFFTFYAAIARKDANGFPEGGFFNEQALSREEALRGITIWPAKAAFLENSHGSLEIGKRADFIWLDKNLLLDSLNQIRNSQSGKTFIQGKLVN